MTIKRCYPVLIGASVGENQLIQNGDFADGTTGWSSSNATQTIENGVLKIQLTAQGGYGAYHVTPVVNGHVTANVLEFKGVSGVTYWTNDTFGIITGTGSWQTATFIQRQTANLKYINIADRSESDFQPHYIKSAMMVDLTAKFGTSIADYIYSLETATAGAGIAKLRSWGFLRGYQAYNSGAIESVEVTGKKVVGFNQLGEEWEVGGYTPSTGEPVALTDRIREKNYIPVIPSATYYFAMPSSASGNVFFYDADKTFLSSMFLYAGTFTVPSGARYMHVAMQPVYGTTYNHDICINLSNPNRNGEYEPYKSITYSLGNDTLRGLFKLDANNNLYADGDRKEADGTITRRYGAVDLGTLNWNIQNNVFYGLIPSCKKYFKGINAKYPQVIKAYTELNDKEWSNNSGTGYNMWVKDSSYSDLAAFKTAMSGVTLVYELATPATEQSAPFTSPQICYPDGTEEFVTENDVPVGHETKYQL